MPLKAIPSDAAIVIQVNDFRQLISNIKENDVWEKLAEISCLKRADIQMDFVDSLIRTNDEIRSLLLDKPAFISTHIVGKDKTGYLYLFCMPKGLNEKRITEIIKKQVEESGTITSRKYEGFQVYDVRLLKEDIIKNFTYSVADGLLIIGFSSILVEDAIRQLSLQESINKDAGFRKVLNTIGKNVAANVFINFQHAPGLLALKVRSEYRTRIRSGDDFASWAALDLNLQEAAILLNGFTLVNDSAKQLLRIFKGQSASRLEVDNVLPSTISSFLTISLSNEGLYFDNMRHQLREKGKLNEYNRNSALLKNKYDIDPNDIFYSQIDEEITLAFESVQSENAEANHFTAIKLKSRNQTEKKLRDAIGKIAAKERVLPEKYFFTYRFDEELTFLIYKLPLDDFLKYYLGTFFDCCSENYFTFIENYLVFGNSVKSLTEFIRSNVLNQTLITDVAYREHKNNLSPKATVTFYVDLSRAHMSFAKYVLPEIIKEWENNIQVFQKVQTFGFQLSPQKEMIYTNIYLKSVTEYKDKPRTVWESLLDTTFDFKPQLVINHNTRQTEIFIQDNNNNIYLINQVGRILWKQKLSQKINSGVFQIDYYSNGKLQLLFSTPDYLHLIDRNGNYVERYPVRLRSTATNGMALFDYDNNKNYRIFIAGEDKKVYAYSKEGSLVKGWNFGQTESIVSHTINHFRVGTRDYIVFGDRLRTYILDRKGNTRVNVRELIPGSENNNYHAEIKEDPGKSFIAMTDTAGLVYRIYFNEKIEKVDIVKCSPEHYFDFKDMDGDGNKDYVFLDQDKLMVYKHDKSQLFSHDFDHTIDLPPVYYHFAAKDRKIGVTAGKKGLIYLINNDGSLYKGFPLSGNTLFSIGYLGNTISVFNLIVGGDDNFLYNYVVQ
ncbi:MAG: hypothetical protein JW723_09535 [Bacteroidales bacterium]|nr:hypothetical protein [Bacteroidales bacterium]